MTRPALRHSPRPLGIQGWARSGARGEEEEEEEEGDDGNQMPQAAEPVGGGVDELDHSVDEVVDRNNSTRGLHGMPVLGRAVGSNIPGTSIASAVPVFFLSQNAAREPACRLWLVISPRDHDRREPAWGVEAPPISVE